MKKEAQMKEALVKVDCFWALQLLVGEEERRGMRRGGREAGLQVTVTLTVTSGAAQADDAIPVAAVQ